MILHNRPSADFDPEGTGHFFSFLNSIFFFIANTYTKESLKTVQIHGKITKEKNKVYWDHQFYDTARNRNEVCRVEELEGPPADRSIKNKDAKKKTKNRNL